MPESTSVKLLREDFRNFLCYTWRHLSLPDPTVCQYQIADYLQSGPKRKVIEGFRGIGKSWITSAYVLWRLWLNHDLKFLVVSASKTRADDFSIFVRMLIDEMSILQHLRPRDEQRSSMVAFDVGPAKPAHAPSVKAVGIFGQLAGQRPDIIVADDVEVPNTSMTVGMRDKLAKAIGEFEALITPGGEINFLGTPQTEESIYNDLPSKGYGMRIWPAQVPKSTDMYNGNLAIEIEKRVHAKEHGEPTDPMRFTLDELAARRAGWGKSGYTLQFMLDTSLSDQERYPLKTSDLIVTGLNTLKAPIALTWSGGRNNAYEDIDQIGFSGDRFHFPMMVDTKHTEYTGSVMAIDPSGRGADETAWCVIKHLHGFLFLVDEGGESGGFDQKTLKTLGLKAAEHKVAVVLVESNFGQGMFSNLFGPVLRRYHAACSIEEVHQNVQKEKRVIDTLEPILGRHKLVVDEALVRRSIKQSRQREDGMSKNLFYQLTRITRERGCLRFDDRIDNLATACTYFIDSVGRLTGEAIKTYRHNELKRQMETFKHGVVMDKGLGGPRCPGGRRINGKKGRPLWTRA